MDSTTVDSANADSTDTGTPDPRAALTHHGDDAGPLAAIPAPRTAPDAINPESEATVTHAPGNDSAEPEAQDPDEFSYASIYHLTAASRSGGLMRGNLAVLIRYWTRGRGAARIGWGRGGDFMRCVRQLSRYVPPTQVKGFCARLHKRATGSWPGPGRDH